MTAPNPAPPSRRRRRRLAATALALALAAPAPVAVRAAPPEPPPSAALAEGSRPWIFARLAEADGLLRRGRPRAAARAFREVFVHAEGTEWGTLAELGLAWSLATSGDVELGRALAADAHASAGAAAETTRLVLVLLAARAGDAPAALALLDRAPPAADPTHAAVLALARAYALFWSGSHAAAAAAFEAVAALPAAGPLVDDARYGAAWSRFAAGERAAAIAALEALVAAAPAGFAFRTVPRRLVELDARAILSTGTRRHRRGERLSPAAELARLLDADGFSRAHSALRVLDPARFGPPLAPLTAAAEPAGYGMPATAVGAPAPHPGRAETALPAGGTDAGSARRELLRVGLGVVVLALLAVLVWSLTRRRAAPLPIAGRGRTRPR